MIDDGSPDDTAEFLRRTAAEPTRGSGRWRPPGRARTRPATRAWPPPSGGSSSSSTPTTCWSQTACGNGSSCSTGGRTWTTRSTPCGASAASRATPTGRGNTITDEDDLDRFLQMDGPWQTTGVTWRRPALDRGRPVGRAGAQPARPGLPRPGAGGPAAAAEGERLGLPLPAAGRAGRDHRARSRTAAHTPVARPDRPPAVRTCPTGCSTRTPRRRELLAGVLLPAGRPVRRRRRRRRRRRGCGGTPAGGGRSAASGTPAGWRCCSATSARGVAGRLRWRACRQWPPTSRGEFRSTLFNASLPPALAALDPDPSAEILDAAASVAG